MKTNRRSICTAPPFINLRARGTEQSIAHPCGFNRKKPWNSWNRRPHGHQSWSRHFGEQINILALPGFGPFGHSLDFTLITLSWSHSLHSTIKNVHSPCHKH